MGVTKSPNHWCENSCVTTVVTRCLACVGVWTSELRRAVSLIGEKIWGREIGIVNSGNVKKLNVKNYKMKLMLILMDEREKEKIRLSNLIEISHSLMNTGT